VDPADSAFIWPDWPAPNRVKAVCTTRNGGVSQGPWASLNLGDHVADNPDAVAGNRASLSDELKLPACPQWLQQVHGVRVVNASLDIGVEPPQADAAWSDQAGCVLAVMTADCLPILITSRCGKAIAAAHGGWRGLAGGIVQETVTSLPVAASKLIAWLGPAIGPQHFEVGSDVCAAFADPDFAPHFVPREGMKGKYLADIFGLARVLLHRSGVTEVYGGGLCTVADSRFYSHRRDAGVTGRMAALIWRQ